MSDPSKSSSISRWGNRTCVCCCPAGHYSGILALLWVITSLDPLWVDFSQPTHFPIHRPRSTQFNPFVFECSLVMSRKDLRLYSVKVCVKTSLSLAWEAMWERVHIVFDRLLEHKTKMTIRSFHTERHTFLTSTWEFIVGSMLAPRLDRWRLIMHLSFPENSSANSDICRGDFSLHYTSVDDAIKKILHLGQRCLLSLVWHPECLSTGASSSGWLGPPQHALGWAVLRWHNPASWPP